ncbi:hypothetical protein BDC45DRAFT_539461 [Circinella umbellata]|nr:hypothetical protein BDC45DRAFT_539461 [Circinella umbellata]
MWTLSWSDRKVEKVMQQCAKDNKVEQGAHSMIIDPLDPIWDKYFTEEEREEISSFNRPTLPPLSEKMQEYLQQFEGLVALDDLWKKFRNNDFQVLIIFELFDTVAKRRAMHQHYIVPNFILEKLIFKDEQRIIGCLTIFESQSLNFIL